MADMSQPRAQPKGQQAAGPKVAHTFRVRRELLRRIQRAVRYCAGHPRYMTLQGFIEDALEQQLAKLTDEMRDQLKSHGGSFPDPPTRHQQ